MFDRELYYEEFLRYTEMATVQQYECNLGTIPHDVGTVTDPLMRNVTLYDVVNRKYAGFGQLLQDMWHGGSSSHPYRDKLHPIRKPVAESFTGVCDYWALEEWMYAFIIHRMTGSAIDYKLQYAGYGPTILPKLHPAKNLDDMVEIMRRELPITKCYTSVGYQFAAGPKCPEGGRATDNYLLNYAPPMVRGLGRHLLDAKSRYSFRELGDWMSKWNVENGLRVYHFQHAAFLADIADFFPELVAVESPFFYGTNAKECLSYFTGGKKSLKALDEVVLRACDDTGGLPYDVEDIFCDFIRYVENYVRPGDHYDHLDRDILFNHSKIDKHPYGRQRWMLDLGLIHSFNTLPKHPSDDFVIGRKGLTLEDVQIFLN